MTRVGIGFRVICANDSETRRMKKNKARRTGFMRMRKRARLFIIAPGLPFARLGIDRLCRKLFKYVAAGVGICARAAKRVVSVPVRPACPLHRGPARRQSRYRAAALRGTGPAWARL